VGRPKVIVDEDVLAVARRVFRESGHAASTREIAAEAGISQAVLFQRFGSKDELFFRAMTPEPADLDALLGPYPPRDAREDLLAIAERLHAYMHAFMPTMLKVLAFPGVGTERLREWHDQLPFPAIAAALTERFRRLARDGLIARGDARAAAIAFMAEIHALAFFETVTRPRDRPRHGFDVRGVVGVLWRGLEPR
jgi:AcrR family transcriptional regulator